jgi:hypothetical protein
MAVLMAVWMAEMLVQLMVAYLEPPKVVQLVVLSVDHMAETMDNKLV